MLEQRLDTVRDSKSWWTIAREIRQHENSIGCGIKAEDMTQYFNALLNPCVNSVEISYVPNLSTDEYLDMPFSLLETKTQIAKTKINKAPGEDRIPYEFFKNASDEYLDALINVFTNILEGSEDFDLFRTSIIFPLHKKGDVNQPNNYRGISFMNCIAKIMMGMVNERICEWVDRNKILNEYQAGFRKGYSTVDNVYNLTAIINLKLAKKRKVYAFFVDFRAAFDRIPRNLLVYKLHQMGMSTKVVNFIANVYQNTKSAVWNGNELSSYFETKSGVKQGCLLSPLLFTLYLNDLHDYLGGGLFLEDDNIRLLMYADDIVLLADDVRILQNMIHRLEDYCKEWAMEVNLNKSEIMIFRKGGRIGSDERWMYNGEELKIVSEYKYLGVILTPQLSFTKHVMDRNNSAKLCLNVTWKNYIGKNEVSLTAKWKMFLAVCRSIQTYGAQIWGYSWFDEVNKLYRFFTKRILKLPDNTPNYVLALETNQEEGYCYSYGLHLKYVGKTIFEYASHRLPHILSKKIITNNLYWSKALRDKLQEFNLDAEDLILSKYAWSQTTTKLLENMAINAYQTHINLARQSQNRIYRHLDFSMGFTYCTNTYNQHKITCIMKARADMLNLNASPFRENEARMCSMCNLREEENMIHFLGKCPILRGIRLRYFHCYNLTDEEVINILNGGEEDNWYSLYNYIRYALNYRSMLIREYNN